MHTTDHPACPDEPTTSRLLSGTSITLGAAAAASAPAWAVTGSLPWAAWPRSQP